MSTNINAKLLKVYLKRADTSQQLEMPEGGGQDSSPAVHSGTPLGMTPEQFAGHNPEAIKARAAQRAAEAAQRLIDANIGLQSDALGTRTQEQQNFNDPAAIRERMSRRPLDSKGIPTPTYRDMESWGTMGNADTARMRQELTKGIEELFENSAANNNAEYERARELAAELAANDAATTMGVRFPRNTEELKAEALGLFDASEAAQKIDDEERAVLRGEELAANDAAVTGEVRFVPKWRSELRSLLEEEKQRAAQIDEANARAGDDAVREFREGQQSAAKARTGDSAKPQNAQGQNAKPQNAKPQNAQGQNAKPQNAKPQNVEPSYLAGLLNPTGNQMADYGIYGGLGALLGGGLGGLFSDKKNRLRNALLFALLGGGLGLGAKYVGDRYSNA